MKDLILGLVAARAGSKGVKSKNLQEINGQSLIQIAISKLIKSNLIHTTIISSDSQEMIDEGMRYGAKEIGLRNSYLSNDQTGKFDVWKDAVKQAEEKFNLKFDYLVDVDCTNPFVTIEDIEESMRLMQDNRCDVIIPICKSKRNPYFNIVEKREDGTIFPSKIGSQEGFILSRQSAPSTWDHYAGVYVIRRDFLMNSNHFFDGSVVGHEMTPSKCLDIDTEEDLEYARFLAAKFL